MLGKMYCFSVIPLRGCDIINFHFTNDARVCVGLGEQIDVFIAVTERIIRFVMDTIPCNFRPTTRNDRRTCVKYIDTAL